MSHFTEAKEGSQPPDTSGPHLFRDGDQVLHLQAVDEDHVVLHISANTTLSIQRLAPESGKPDDKESTAMYEIRAMSRVCPKCDNTGESLGVLKGKHIATKHCARCDITFGWDVDGEPLMEAALTYLQRNKAS